MVAQVSTVAFNGLEAVEVEVQVNMVHGQPRFSVVGLPDKAIAESRDRVRAALSSLGLAFPSEIVIVNLSPADITKEGSHYDLAIIASMLCYLNVLPTEELANFLLMGELALDGRIGPVNGMLPAAMKAVELGKGVICPPENAKEATWSGNETILAPHNLLGLINHFKGTQVLTPHEAQRQKPAKPKPRHNLSEVKGQETAKRCLEIAAAGGHNLLMSGPPGAGKSLLASCLPGILPALEIEEMLECSMIQSINGELKEGTPTASRPFRDPHHNCSVAAMVGGGRVIKPGEITLAHNGVLFLDELPEFPKNVLESLRQPLETKSITIARAQSHITFPAKFQLLAAMNPCRCGYLTDPEKACSKAPKCGLDYQAKLSGPLLDRIDLYIEVPAISPNDLYQTTPTESSETVAARVMQLRALQQERYQSHSISTNAEANGKLLLHIATPDDKGKALLTKAVDKLGLSMRGYNRILRVSRTIADMEQKESINHHHVAEALMYRNKTLQNQKTGA